MRLSFWLAILALAVAPSGAQTAVRLDLEALMDALAVSGREEPAAGVVAERLPKGSYVRDRLGNVVMTLGQGEPQRLIACGLDEPGLVISEIRDDGYLRLRPAGPGGRSSMWAQGFEGQKVWISTARGRTAGALSVPSIHLFQDGAPENTVFSLAHAYLDVGAASAEEVRAQGIEMLDPVGRYVRSTSFGDGLVAGPAAQSKASCAALLVAARTLNAGDVEGTLVLAWTRFDLWNRKGIEHLVAERGPFAEALLASRSFGWAQGEEGPESSELPTLGSGVLSAGAVALPQALAGVAHLEPRGAAFTDGPDWGSAAVGYYAIPARYRETQVETVSLADVGALATALVDWGTTSGQAPSATSLPSGSDSQPRAATGERGHEVSAALLAELVSVYGVSGHEGAVRDAVRARLPAWAEPRIDARGNLLVEFGEGEEHVAFVAHLDEVGFVVERILEDGRLELARRGGLAPSLWEAQSALVHTAAGAIPGVFEPRIDYLATETRSPAGPLTVFLGAGSQDEAAGLGIAVGDPVTMPKQMERLGAHRAVARGFDDRVGSTAQLLALQMIDPTSVDRRVTFAWVVEEETGLFGSVAMGKEIVDIDRVHAVDTFVSSDDPYPGKGFARTPLGQGAVLRAMDNSYLADRATLDYVRGVAAGRGIPVQIGFTGGGNDGTAFIGTGTSNLPLSWPGLASHSPAEIMDLRDLETLVELIAALVEE